MAEIGVDLLPIHVDCPACRRQKLCRESARRRRELLPNVKELIQGKWFRGRRLNVNHASSIVSMQPVITCYICLGSNSYGGDSCVSHKGYTRTIDVDAQVSVNMFYTLL